jgi:hypothetical protein
MVCGGRGGRTRAFDEFQEPEDEEHCDGWMVEESVDGEGKSRRGCVAVLCEVNPKV